MLRRSASMRLVARRGAAQFRLRWHAGLLRLEMRQQGLLIAVAEPGRIEGLQLAVEDMRGYSGFRLY
jgi:hypothetical protein